MSAVIFLFHYIKGFKKTSRAFYFVFLAALIFVVYSPAQHHFFIADDGSWLMHARDVHNLLKPHAAYWRPMTSLYFFLAFHVFGLAPAPYHLMNIFFHVLNLCLLFYVVRELNVFFHKTENPSSSEDVFLFLPCIFVSISFCFFQAILWVSIMHDLLCLFFYLLSLLVLLKGLRKGSSFPGISGLFYACALLSKEQALTFFLTVMPLVFASSAPKSLKLRILKTYVFITVGYGFLYLFFASPLASQPLSRGYHLYTDYHVDRAGVVRFFKLSFEIFGSVFGFTDYPYIRDASHTPFFRIPQILSMFSFLVLCAGIKKRNFHCSLLRGRVHFCAPSLFCGLYFFAVNLFPLSFFTFLETPLDGFSARYHYYYIPFFGFALFLSGFLEAAAYGSKKKPLMNASLAAFTLSMFLINVQANQIPLRDYNALSNTNATLINAVAQSVRYWKREIVFVVTENEHASYLGLEVHLPYFLDLYLDKKVFVRWLSEKEFKETRELSDFKNCILIFAASDGFVDRTKNMDQLLQTLQKNKRTLTP